MMFLMRSRREHWLMRHGVSGQVLRRDTYDCENGMLAIERAGERDVLADYLASDSPLRKRTKRQGGAKKRKDDTSSRSN